MAKQAELDRKSSNTETIALVGYSNHAFTVVEILRATGRKIIGYCEKEEKLVNPYGLTYLGSENQLGARAGIPPVCFPAMGRNDLREAVAATITGQNLALAAPVIHPTATVSGSARIAVGTLVGAAAVINAQAVIAEGVIINTAAVVEHDCSVEAYAHVAPGAVLTGNVRLGARVFVGAGAVILPGVIIGEDVTIGAGAVVLRDVPPGKTFVGNPARELI